MFLFLRTLIEFAIAISVIRSIARFVFRAWSGMTSRTGATGPAQRSSSPPTMLKQDPVCGTYVAIDSSLKTIKNGQVIHFCSPECRDKYLA
jgi:YHS domain-containing protein